MKLRILHVLPNLAPGGAERTVAHLLRDIDKDEFDVKLLSMFNAGGWELEHSLSREGISIEYLGKAWGPDPRMVGRIAKVIDSFQPHLIHTHLYVLRYALWPILRKGVPAIHTFHNLATKDVEPPARLIHRHAFRRGVRAVGVGLAVQKSIEQMYGTPALNIPNAIPVNLYKHPKVRRSEWREKEGISSETTVFVSVARFHPQKNHALLLKAFAQGPGKLESTLLLLAGDGPLRERSERLVRTLGIENRVRFLGVRRDVPDLLSACDVSVLSSDWEGKPLAGMESMAAGLPFVSTPAGGVTEIVSHGVDGLLVPFREEKKLADALTMLATDPALRLRLGAAATKRAEAEMDCVTMARSYENLYREVRDSAEISHA